MVLIVHHAGKDPAKGARGFSGLRGAADVEICIGKGVMHNVATITKMKDGSDQAVYPFKLIPVELPPYEGEPVSSCIVEQTPRTETASRVTERTGAKQKAVLSAIRDLDPMGQSGSTPADILDLAIESIPFDAGADPAHPKRDQRRTHLKRALDELCASRDLFLKDGLIFLYDPDVPTASLASIGA